ncbi:hypothetical protein L1887_18063 [Cichorium endivia]|nr:hypothetical protein L1887_18063 [Cichorium endivia]
MLLNSLSFLDRQMHHKAPNTIAIRVFLCLLESRLVNTASINLPGLGKPQIIGKPSLSLELELEVSKEFTGKSSAILNALVISIGCCKFSVLAVGPSPP